MANVSDESLLRQIRGGAADALAVLFDRYYRQVFTLARGILRDGSLAEEVMQEVFLQVYRDAARFDPARGSVKAWILECATARSLNRCRDLKLPGASKARAAACGD